MYMLSHKLCARNICWCVKSKQICCDLLWMACSVIRAANLFLNQIYCKLTGMILLFAGGFCFRAAFVSLRFVSRANIPGL